MAKNPSSSTLSARGQRSLRPALPYFEMFLHAKQNVFDRQANRTEDGYIPLCVAENHASYEMIRDKFEELKSRPLRKDVQGYDNMTGRAPLRTAFARMAQQLITNGAPVDPLRLQFTCGCGALIEHLGFTLLDEGDAVLLPVPSYAALWNDFGVRAGVNIVNVAMEPSGAVTKAALDAAAAEAVGKGMRPRMLFIINPNNPLGTVLSEADLSAIIEWAEDYREPGCNTRTVHCVIDEIYALSVFNAAATPFISAAALLRKRSAQKEEEERYLGDYNHVIWGFSKDFCFSGVRAGALFSHNDELARAMSNTGYFTSISYVTQDILADLVADVKWVEEYVVRNNTNLLAIYTKVAAALKEAGIPFLEAGSAFFVWIDMRKCLVAEAAPSSGGGKFASEDALTALLFKEEKVIMTPGGSVYASEPGFYRLCYAWPTAEALDEALLRLKRFYLAHATK